ncbi:MAG: NUDIX domain-containing protein [Microscillaceae bacterium]|nr:NUDIX domain-containing protein [Microscillaceae bacterium]MDW8460415.1 NUDIX domain-containing protein [Cytophagales bacterium]
MASKEELLDYFDAQMQYLGTATRQYVHEKGLWHKVIHVWIAQEIDGQIYVLFQQRSKQKKTFPNCLDISAAGHFSAGESEHEALREITEELGISPLWQDMLFLGILPQDYGTLENHTNREFCYTYLYKNQFSAQAFQIPTHEVATLFWIELQSAQSFFQEKQPQIEAIQFFTSEKQYFQLTNFVPATPHYYCDILHAIEQYFCSYS